MSAYQGTKGVFGIVPKGFFKYFQQGIFTVAKAFFFFV